MTRGLVILLFIVFIIIIVFLGFQVNENNTKCKLIYVTDQEALTKASRLILQSLTNTHPLFAHENAQEAKYIIDQVIHNHGGISLTERDLKLPKGRLEHLKNQIYNQFSDRQAMMMDKIIGVHQELDVDLNEDAGLKKRKRKSRSKSEKSHSNH